MPSTFTDYSTAAATNYDFARLPIGIETISGYIHRLSPNKNFSDNRILDLGCGTASYPALLLQEGVQHVTCADFSQSMLDQAQKKLAKMGYTRENGRVDFVKIDLPSLQNFELESYDVILCSMVIHHLVNTETDANNNTLKVNDWTPIIQTFQEAFRVLKPDGLIIIAYSTPEQRGGNWYADLVPKAKAKTIARCPSGRQVRGFLKQANFGVICEMSMLSHYCGYENYNNENIFLENEKAWKMDSVLSSASEEELEEAKLLVKTLYHTGQLKNFYETHDDFPKFGCGRIVAAVKNNDMGDDESFE